MASAPMPISPAEGQASPGATAALGKLTGIANEVKSFGQAYPQTADEMQQIGDLLQQVLRKVMTAQPPAEPAAPPV